MELWCVAGSHVNRRHERGRLAGRDRVPAQIKGDVCWSTNGKSRFLHATPTHKLRSHLAREGFPGNAAISPGRRRAWSADPWAQSIRREISPTMRLYLATVTVCDASSVRRWLASRRRVSTVCGAVARR